MMPQNATVTRKGMQLNLRIVKKNPKHISNIENSKTISSIEI